MTVPENLVKKIEETRIRYPERNGGIGVSGSPLSCDFDETVDPEVFCDTIRTAKDPWRMFGVKCKVGEDYWNVVGNLFHIEDETVIDASKISLEVAPEWVRIYVKEGCSAERAAEFIESLDEEFGVEVSIPGAEHTETV